MTELEKARHAKRWTQDELSAKSGVSRPRIGQIEKGSEPGVIIGQKLAAALGMSVGDLWPLPKKRRTGG